MKNFIPNIYIKFHYIGVGMFKFSESEDYKFHISLRRLNLE